VRLYRFPEPVVSASGPKVTRTITQFEMFVYRYVSADISPSGDIALKAGAIAYIWPRTAPTAEATMNAHPAAPCNATLIASEAIGWAPDGLWTVSDGVAPAPIVRLAFAP
jgi:hypothetical protein